MPTAKKVLLNLKIDGGLRALLVDLRGRDETLTALVEASFAHYIAFRTGLSLEKVMEKAAVERERLASGTSTPGPKLPRGKRPKT